MRRTFPFILSVSSLLLAAACGSSSDNTGGNTPAPGSNNDAGSNPGTGNDAGSADSAPSSVPDAAPDAGPFVMATHAPFPQLVDQGGPVMTAPKVVTITFPNDPNVDQLESFGKTVASSPWWDAVRAGYCETGSTTNCVGVGPAGTAVRLTTAPGAAYSDSQDPAGTSTLKTFITSLLTAKTIPAPDANTLLMFYFPKTTTITLNGSAASCQQFGGYHQSVTFKGTEIPYAIVPECDPQTASVTPLQETTLAASHELVEAATDPVQSATSIGYYLDQSKLAEFFPWNNIGGGESGDMCADQLGAGQDHALENGFTVQRIWSNAAAKLGGDPCVPKSASPFFSAAPETKGQFFKVEVGKTFTFNAIAFSDSAVAPWTVEGIDINATQANRNPYMTITVNGQPKAVVNNGDVIQVAVTLTAEPGDMVQQSGGATGALVSVDKLPAPTAGHLWPFVAYTQADATDAGFIVPQKAQSAIRSFSNPAVRAHALSLVK